MVTHDHALPALLFASAHASVHFAQGCLEQVGEHLRAKSTFVDPQGRTMHWHDFGDLEGPGWAANAIGGALLLMRWGLYVGDASICRRALQLAEHVLEDGFVRSDGFIWPYWDLAEKRTCLNYTHTNDWLCPGSLAKVGVQMLDLADVLEASGEDTRHISDLRQTASGLGDWLAVHVPLLPNGWVPRRITLEGEAYPRSPDGGPDPIFDHSADGLFLLALWARQGRSNLARRLGDAFTAAGGFWGSINHDTYDDHENVAYAVAFRVLRGASDALSRPEWRRFAYEVALPAMQAFRMERDEHGVVTEGLYWMEKSWDTAYLWENAEVAQAHLEAWLETEVPLYGDLALATLAAIAHHHHGPLGFLTEGIDWNNHVSQRHHVEFVYYGGIRYTEPLLNNLHLVGPTLTYLQSQPLELPGDLSLQASLDILSDLAPTSEAVDALHVQGGRYLLRLFYPAIATDEGVAAALAFAREAKIDGVLLFEASYDTDPALLTLDVLRARFARLRALVPRFRAAGLEVHINVMITMGHADGGGGRPEAFSFQFLVDAQGGVSRSTACPLDPAFLDYAGELYKMAAECRADAIWMDDDVRFLLHGSGEMTCFCPLHLSAMAERTGRTWTREALTAALADDATDRSLRQTWFGLQASAMEGLAARAAGETSLDQSIGLMTVGTSVHNAEGRRTDRLLRVLSGAGPGPMLRPGSGFWHDWEPAAVLAKTEDVARQVAYLGKDVKVVAEIENHPYSPFQKSHRVLALELALNVLAGTHDLSLNLFSSTMPFDEGELGLSAFLRSQRPFLQALARVRAGKRRLGVGVEAREDVPRQARLSGRGLMAWVEARPWEIALARLGLPVGTLYDAPHLLAGDVVYTDRYAIGSALQDGAVLTPGAVRGLLAQGWGERLGIREVVPAPKGVNEVFTSHGLNRGYHGECLQVRQYASQLMPHTFVFSGAGVPHILSEWLGLDGHPVGPAAVALELPEGHRVGLLPFEIETVSPALLQPARRDQWAGLLGWVARAALPVRVIGGVNIAPQVFASPGREDVLVALVNLSADDTVACLDAPVFEGLKTFERLTPEGDWTVAEDPLTVSVDAWSVSVLRAT